MSERKKLLGLFNTKPFDIEVFRQGLELNSALRFPVKEKEIIAILEKQEYEDASQFFRWDRIKKTEKAWQKFCSKWGDDSPILNWSPVGDDDSEPRLYTMYIEVSDKYDIKDVKKDVKVFASKQKGLDSVKSFHEGRHYDYSGSPVVGMVVEYNVDLEYFVNLDI